jgi:hypothetical protein
MKLVFLWLGLLVSLMGTLYCFLALIMAGSFGETPNYPRARLEYNVSFWSVGILLFLGVTLVFGFLLIKKYIKHR